MPELSTPSCPAVPPSAAHAGPGATAAPLQQATMLLAEARVLIQATTLTARGEPIPGQSALRAGVRVMDCNYGPKVAVLLDAARACGAAVAIDGLGMLVRYADYRSYPGEPHADRRWHQAHASNPRSASWSVMGCSGPVG